MSSEAAVLKEHGNSYNIFILVLTLMSLAIMVLLVLPLDEQTQHVLRFYDNAICVVFLIDFAINVRAARPRNAYLVGRRGWLDLLGSIPSLGFVPFVGLLRLFRVFRLARISRLMRGNNRQQLIDDVIGNRSQYAVFITVLSGFIVLTVSTVLMIQFESQSPDANITTGGDALWWGFTTITTVGYGDQFPVTFLGRVTAVLVMFAGVGIIGSLASILASVLVPPPKETDSPAIDGLASSMNEAVSAGPPTDTAPAMSSGAIAAELASIRAELSALRESLAQDRPDRT